jgi:DNA polymerase-3 subunit epsilon
MADMIDFVAIDFETANESRNSACAIGLTTVRDGRIVDTFSRLIRPPELRFASWNSSIHGLTEDDVKDSATFDCLWPELLPLLENQLVVAHNASFDISVLRHSLLANSIPIPPLAYLCSIQLSRCVWPHFVSHSLGFIADSLGISLDHHDAGSDSRASAEIVLRSLQKTGATSIIALANAFDIKFGELYSAEEWKPSTAPSFCSNRESIAIELPEGYDISSHAFFGRKIAFTGKLRMFGRKDAFRIIEQFGGFPSDSVTEETAYLIAGYQDSRMLAKGITESSKLQKAKKLRESGSDLRIISESDFTEMILGPTRTGTE